MTIDRRTFLKATGGAAAATLAGAGLQARAGSTPNPADRKLLFVLAATGGASIIDSFLPVPRSEVDDDALADTLSVYEDSQVAQPAGSNIRCVQPFANTSPWTVEYDLRDFVKRHGEDMVVMAHETTSVNHFVASGRAVNGAGIHGGRTIMEAVAERYGEELLLPNCNMALGGYLEPGTDHTVASFARGEVVSAPRVFAAAMDGMRGIPGAPDRSLVERARAVRRDLDMDSDFGRTFAASPLRQKFLDYRENRQPQLEAADLITKLQLLPQDMLPPEYALAPSPQLDAVHNAFPRYLEDELQAQGALALLLAYYGVACSVTLGLQTEPAFADGDIIATPIAFDYSHTNHPHGQNVMWGRVAKVLDGLITALKSIDYLGDPSLGKMWDRSLVYVATDFGREKHRPSGAETWGTAHNLNNGALFVSPLLKGNRVYGGVDPTTCMTYGFDRDSGDPDPGATMLERDVYSLIAQAMDIDFTGRRDFPAIVRGA